MLEKKTSSVAAFTVCHLEDSTGSLEFQILRDKKCNSFTTMQNFHLLGIAKEKIPFFIIKTSICAIAQ